MITQPPKSADNIASAAAPASQEYSKWFLVAASSLLVVLAFMFFYGLSVRPLQSYDEAIYGEIAKEAVASDHYIGLTWLGNVSLQQPWLGESGMHRSAYFFEKPPLIIWLVALNYKLFGVSSFDSRVWDALLSLATAALACYFSKKIFRSDLAALLTVSAFFLCFQFLQYSGQLQLDIPVGLFGFGAAMFFYLALSEPKFYYWFWGFLALGLMTKNIIGLIPLAVLGMFALVRWDFRFLKLREFWLGFGLFLAIALPWHVYALLSYRQIFWNQYVTTSILQRFSATLNNDGGGWNFYWNILRQQRLLFYSSLASIVYFLYKISQDRRGVYTLVILSIALIFLVFSGAHSKLPPYILPIYPWLAILNGTFWAAAVKKIRSVSSWLSMLSAAVIFLATLGFGVRYTDYKNRLFDQATGDEQKIGQFLKTDYPNLNVYIYNNVGTEPSIIFYSDRVIYHLNIGAALPEKNLLLISAAQYVEAGQARAVFSTPTEQVYLVSN